jgi:AcrR family transcriptional regulator
MSKTKKTGADASTEEKIKNAARTVFLKKGYAATRTRDIAEEAGINLALLNYYFRSKEKLFEIIMLQTLFDFYQTILIVLNDENTDFKQKIEVLVAKYIDKMQKEPHIPLFILNELQNRPEDFLQKVPIKDIFYNTVFFRQFYQEVETGKIAEPNLVNFLMNLMSLVIIPFVAQPLIKTIGGISSSQFTKLLEERKKMIPAWINAMFMLRVE